MIVPYEVAGQTGESGSVQFSDELTRNLYFKFSETNGRYGAFLFPGLKLVAIGSGIDRGHHVMNGVRYVVNGTSLIEESSTGTRTILGTISGADRAIFEDDGTNLYIVANSQLYKYDGSSLSTVSQSVVKNVASITLINRVLIITGDNGQFAVSDVGNSDFNALNTAVAETRSDALFRAYYWNQLIYMFGVETTELWNHTGSGNPPVRRQDTTLINMGVAGKYAITNTDEFLYALGDDRKIKQIKGATSRSINTAGASKIINKMSVVSDCICSTMDLDGQNFVFFKFPTENVTLVYSENNNYFVELNSGTNVNFREAWLGNAVHRCYGKNLVTDATSGNTYELDENTYTDNGETRLWIKTLPNFTAKDIRILNRQVLCMGIRFRMQVGVGLTTGQGSEPKIMCELSGDGGHTWVKQIFVDIGKQGNYTQTVDFYEEVTGYEVKARVMGSDPVPITLWNYDAELLDGGY